MYPSFGSDINIIRLQVWPCDYHDNYIQKCVTWIFLKSGPKLMYNAVILINKSTVQNQSPQKSLQLLLLRFSTCINTVHECHTAWVKLNHIIFIQCFWPSLCCWHVHIDVHHNSDLRQLQHRVWHCFRQAHEIISRQLSGIGFKDIRIGCIPGS